MGQSKQTPAKTRKRRTKTVGLTLAVILSACAQGPSGQATDNQATHNPTVTAEDSHDGLLVARQQVPGHLAFASGTLKMKNGCAVLDDGRSAHLLVWPIGSNFSADHRSIVVPQDDGTLTTYEFGTLVTLVGGGVSYIDGSSSAYQPPGNPACKGQAWIVSSTKPPNGVPK